MIRKKWLNGAILTSVAALGLSTAQAAETVGTDLIVSALVIDVCAVVATPVVFGDVGLTDVNANGTLVITCTNSGSFDVALDGGDADDISARVMSEVGGETLGYQLYTEDTLTTVWGDGTTGEVVTTTGPVATLTVYGETTTTPTVLGAYTDTVGVTVTY